MLLLYIMRTIFRPSHLRYVKILVLNTPQALDMFDAGLVEMVLNVLSRIACYEEVSNTTVRSHKAVVASLHKLLVASAVKMFRYCQFLFYTCYSNSRSSLHCQHMILSV